MSLLKESDYARIEQTIGAVERETAAELVVAVVGASDGYAAYRALAAGLWTVLLAALALAFTPLAPLWIVAAQLPLAMALWALFGLPKLCRAITPRGVMKDSVQARAFELFSERGVHNTADRTGVLLLLSELEHQVVILGDRGIHDQIGDNGWKEHASRIVTRVREGRAAEGIVETLEQLRPLLVSARPVREDDRNELPDQVVREP